MQTPKNLKQLQRRVYWYYHQDGLVDILFGLGVIGFGLMLMTGIVVFNILAWIPCVFYMPIKKAITIPRLGYVRMQSKRTQLWGWISVLFGLVILGMVLGLLIMLRNDRLPANWQTWLRAYDMLIIGGLLSMPLMIISFLTGLRRMLGYVGLIFMIIVSGAWLGIEPPIYMIALGVIILLVGCLYLGTFLIRYPIDKQGAQNDR